MQTFQAYVLNEQDGTLISTFEKRTYDSLPEGNVTIRIYYSSINYKDMLATQPNNKIIRQYPRIPGIDLAGIVIDSQDPNYRIGDKVIATGYDLGVTHDGGYSEITRLNGGWLVPLPDNLTLEEAMIIGTAGFTAALSIQALEDNGLATDKGPVLVRGASGGVGSIAALILNKLGYTTIASSSKPHTDKWMQLLGVQKTLPRINQVTSKPLGKTEWQAAIDPVGGDTIEEVLKRIHPYGAIALSGNASGIHFSSSVFPFILRGVRLLGIDSVYVPMPHRQKIWQRLASDMKPEHLHDIKHVVPFNQLETHLLSIQNKQHTGRIVIDMQAGDDIFY
ncbi:oxidoreductase [Staphylococcus sp. 17KM0847]|uniref:oxidoreductase n=1 Tax=Staphylococcus sp. 17KM0847 TaxID=2583989 RepID=UPI0015DC74F6|nr:oxidoreductase [Staphylococcus sp. 17KM0847]QLK86728.1 oxidoreductase [Staphylococcus sp. 17KM0847]